MSTNPDLIVATLAIAGTAAAALVDLRTRRVPNVLTMALCGAGVVLALLGVGGATVPSAFAGAVVGLILMLPGHVLGKTGAGDVKLMAAVGTLLGPSATVVAFLATAIAGGGLALLVAARRRRLLETCGALRQLVATGGANAAAIEAPGMNNRFAYAPAIAMGASFAALRGLGL